MKHKFLLFTIFLFTFVLATNAQVERIISYDVQIEIKKDRSLFVTEYIKVHATGNQIKRGITRDFPSSRYLNGQKISTKYKILEVTKDGQPEPYFVKNNDGAKILYIGRKDVMLTTGDYVYKIDYLVPNQIGFYNDYDEIYWNAIGTNVRFIIEQASCRIRIPNGASISQESAYVGMHGERSKDYTLTKENSVYDYRSSRKLNIGEGLTIGIGFKKGFFNPPSIMERYGTLIVIILAVIFLFPYFIYTWWKHGQDPIKPASYPIYEVPDGLSVSTSSYILKEGYSNKSLTGAIIHLAIKAYLIINEKEKSSFLFSSKGYELIKLKEPDNSLPDEEYELMVNLFALGRTVDIDGEYKSNVSSAVSSHQRSIRRQHRSFITKGNNSKLLILPIIISILVIIISAFLFAGNPYSEGINKIALIIFIPCIIIGLALYYYLIKKPTVEKLALKSRIKGYKMYLEMAEKDRLNLLNPPKMTPKQFELALPFAFALGVEHEWSKTFKNILEKTNYQPQWSNNINHVYFGSQFGRSFSRGMSSTSTQASSSGGGSGGGGFSGGGGGGGGVGGW